MNFFPFYFFDQKYLKQKMQIQKKLCSREVTAVINFLWCMLKFCKKINCTLHIDYQDWRFWIRYFLRKIITNPSILKSVDKVQLPMNPNMITKITAHCCIKIFQSIPFLFSTFNIKTYHQQWKLKIWCCGQNLTPISVYCSML